MAPDTKTPDEPEVERAEEKILDKHRGADRVQTSSALRRLPLLIATMILLVLLLRWLA